MSLGRHRHHHGGGHHGGRGGAWGGSWGWGGPWIEPYPVYLVPGEAIITTDAMDVVTPVSGEEEQDLTVDAEKALQGLSAQEMSNTELAWALVNGTLYDDLAQMRRDAQEYRGRLETSQQAINRMAAGPEKTAALAAWGRAQAAYLEHMTNVQNLVAKYNSVVEEVITRSGNTITPRHLGELGIAPAAIVALILASAAFLAMASMFVSCLRSDSKAKGYIEQLEGLVRASGGAAEQVSTAWVKIAGVVGVGALIYWAWTTGKFKGLTGK